MTEQVRLLPAQLWMQQIFEAKAAREGGIVRRKRRDIERTIGWQVFETEIRRRGYHVVENCGQIVIFCNDAPIRQVI
nr:N-(5'-phosphoribosyl)anthranilate isomerase [Aliiroseovarius sp. PrR006]